MKTIFKRASKSTLAVVLAICMLLSCMTAAMIATDAAKTAEEAVGAKADSEAVGATTYRYLWYDMSSNNGQLSALTNKVTLSSTDDNYYTGNFSSNGNNIHFIINTSSTAHTTSSLNASTTVTYKGSVASWTRRYENDGNYGVEGQLASGNTYYIGYNVSTNTVIVGSSSSDINSGGSADSDWYVIGHQFDTAWNTGGKSCKMTKDPSTGYFYYEKTFTASSNYYRIHDGSNQYGPANENVITLGTEYTLSTSNSGNAVQISSSLTGAHKVWWDPDNKKTWVAAVETTHNVTFSVDSSTKGTISPSGTAAVGVSTNTAVTATPKAGYQFSSWTNGTGIQQNATTTSGDSATQMITTKSSGTYTVKANFDKKNYTVSYSSASNGTFTVTKTSGGAAVSSGSSVPYQTGITVTCSPSVGYKTSSVKYTNASGTQSSASLTGNTATFSVPAANTTITVTFAKKDNAITTSASPVGGGNVWVASSASSNTAKTTYQIGNTVYLRATAEDAYTFSKFILTYADGTTAEYTTNPSTAIAISDTTHFNGTDGSISVVGYFTAKPTHTITVKTNSVARGTAVASLGSAYEGQSVTLTATEDDGTFNKWTVTSGTVSGVNDNTTNPKTFTMGSTDLVITANFNEYSAASNFYYNSYGSNGQPATTHYAAQMTEAKIGGETYSYYHVTDRTEDDQLFTVSYKSPKYNSYYTFFSIYTGWESGGVAAQFYATDGNNLGDWTNMTFDSWDSSDKKKFHIAIPDGAKSVQFRSNAGNQDKTGILSLTNGNNAWYTSGSTMTDLTAYAQSNPVPVNFYENFNGENKYTNAFSSGGFNNHNANRGASHSYTKPDGLTSATKGDYYILVLYQNKTYTINGVTKTVTMNPEIIWLPQLPSNVPDNTETVNIYAKNGTLRDSNFNRFTNLANTDILTDYFEYSEILDSGVYTYTSIADYNSAHSKEITISNDVTGYGSTYATMNNVPIGAKIKLRTYLSGDTTAEQKFQSGKSFADTHYLKAYSFNGMTYAVHTASEATTATSGYKFVSGDQYYEEIWEVRDVNTKSADGTTNYTTGGKTIEVTPIYYMKDNTNCKTFYIDGYDGTVQNAWGNMLTVYPYYENVSGKANAFGGYPGQPMLYWGGKYQMEIPLTVDGTANGASVKGLTLHNGYWDLLHRTLDIRCNTRNHAQTYDYDDFYKLYKEKNPDTIIFDFKYKTAHDNYGDEYDYTDYEFAGSDAKAASYYVDKNGVELVTDYFGRQVDAFGTLINDSSLSDYGTTGTQDKELLFVSTGYKDTYVGEYATLWAVYAPQSSIPSGSGDTAGKFIGYISSSMLYLNNIDRRLQYTDGDSTANGRMSWTSFVNTYNHLKSYYTGVPALISYEKEIWNDSKDKANRSDGKWYYSNKSDQIRSNIIIQYNSDPTQSAAIVASKDRALADTTKWTTDEFSGSLGVGGYANIGTTTTCSAYFTNTTPKLYGMVDSGTQFADSSKNFTFRADAGGNYMFVNWVRLSNGKYYEISEKELAESDMSSNDTYIARFVISSSGTLKISHVVERNATYKGTGTPSVTVTVKNASDVQMFSKTVTDGSPIDISDFIQTKYSAYKIDISLSTTPDEDCTLIDISTSAAPKYQPGALSSNAATVAQFKVDDIIEGSVTSLRYVSHLTKTEFTYNYEITYTYNSRFWGEQSYTQTGTAVEGDFTGSKTSAKLTTDFIIGKTPYEKNFRQQINWNYTNAAVTTGGSTAQAMANNTATSQGNNTYKMTAHVYSSNTVNDRVTAEFILPYNNRGQEYGYQIYQADIYDSAGAPHVEGEGYEYENREKDNLYDTSHESVTLSTEAYHLFTYDGTSVTGTDGTLASQTPLIEAPEYLIMNPTYHYMPTDSKRYFTGNSFTVGDTVYYLRARPDGSTDDRVNNIVITDPDVAAENSPYVVTFTKRKNMTEYGGDGHSTTYKYAVAEGTPGTLGYKVYFFAYNMNANEDMVDNAGNVITQEEILAGTKVPVFNGQYVCYTETQEIDGIVKNTGTKKYFTRWDIYNTKGDFVASSYSRRFNYSGYDNYVVRPVYESDTEQTYASSTPTGYTSKITFLDDSRNQWKGTGASGTYATDTGQSNLYAADKIFTDFAITYAYEGRDINQVSSSEAKIRTGIVIERLDPLDTAGGKTITDSAYYADKYKGDTSWQAMEAVLNGTSNKSLSNAVRDAAASGTNHNCYKSRIGANYEVTGSDAGYTLFGNEAPGAVNGQSSVVDNFNRLQWFYTFNNSTQSTSGSATTTTTMKGYAYRVISYMIVEKNGTTNAYLTDSPAYFTIYDTASREYN